MSPLKQRAAKFFDEYLILVDELIESLKTIQPLPEEREIYNDVLRVSHKRRSEIMIAQAYFDPEEDKEDH